MPKRVHEDEDDNIQDGDGAESLRELSLPDIEVRDGRILKQAQKMVRVVLAMEFKKQTISRANLQKYLRENESHRVKFSEVFNECQSILRSVFGFELVELPPKDDKKTKSSNQNKTYIVVSILEDDQKDVLGSFWESNVAEYGRTGDLHTSITSNRPIPGDEGSLAASGLTVLIMACVALGGNNINKTQLMADLQENFGISPGLSLDDISGTSEKITFDDFLRLLEKAEYLSKRVERTETVELVEYSLGRRGKLELPYEKLVEFVQSLYGYPRTEQNELLSQQIKLSVGNTYK